MLTPRDLSSPGWRFSIAEACQGTWTCQGESRPNSAITAVLTRLVQVNPNDLTWVNPARGAFMAAEITAFLLAWLETLECPVIPRPSPGCLCGRNWGWPHWAHLAHSLGIPVSEHCVELDSMLEVHVIGNKVIGPDVAAESSCLTWAHQLSAAAAQEISCYHFNKTANSLSLGHAQIELKRLGDDELQALKYLIKTRIQGG
jgi:hypothetical protein